MKKALSLILAVIMLMSTMAVCAFAYIDNGGVCRCLDHTDTKPCKCCLYCSNLDTTYKLDCCTKHENSDGSTYWVKCCSLCNGLEDCECTKCSCCSEKSDEVLNDGSTAVIPPSAQISIVEGFQNAMKKLQKVFDDFFNAIFEFLRIEDFFG